MPGNRIPDSEKIGVLEIDFVTPIREPTESCYHRLPQVGQYYLLECFETYNACKLLYDVGVAEPVKPKSKNYFTRWWGSSKAKA